MTEESNIVIPQMRFEFSPQGVGELIGALAKARKAFKPVVKNSKNPFFKSKYADLAEVLEATKDGLSDNGLAIVQPPAFRRAEGTVEIVTFLGHSSGQWIKSVLDMPVVKTDPQGVGSAITYGRRYAYSGMVSVASEFDDDANAATGNKVRTPEEEKAYELEFDQRTADQKESSTDCIAGYQVTALRNAMALSGKTESDLKAYLDLAKIPALEQVKKGEDFQSLLKWANAKTPAPKTTILPRAAHNWPQLWASAKAKNIPQEDVKRYYRETFNVSTGKDLTTKQFLEVVTWVASLQA